MCIILWLIGIFISIGPIIDEVQEYKYMNNRNCAKSRQLLLIIWLFVGFNLTLCYKEVLLANLVNQGYERPIDNVQDLAHSGRPIFVAENTLQPYLMSNDPRESVKQLLNNIVYYNWTTESPQNWVKEG